MSSKEAEEWVSSSNQGLSIPELIKLLRHAFRDYEFNEVQNILMEREKNLKFEIENLTRDRDASKEEARLLERSQGLVESASLKLEEKLERNRKKCEELKETITRLKEEQRASSDRSKRAEECCDKVIKEDSKVLDEKNQVISELKKKINQLKNNNLESEQLVGEYKEMLKCSDARLVKMGKENEDLRHEKLATNQALEELRQKQFKADQVVGELKHQNLEATQSIDELRLKNVESDKAVEVCKSRLENLEPRIRKVEAALANMLNVKVDDLATIVDTMGTPVAATEWENVHLPDILEGGEDNLGNGSTNTDVEDVVVLSPGVRSTSNYAGSGSIVLSKEGGRDLVTSSTKEDVANMVQTSRGLHPDGNPASVKSNSSAQDNEGGEPQVSGSHASVMHLDGGVPVGGKSMFGARCSSKISCSSFASGDVIEIGDSDDERNQGGTAYTSDASSWKTSERNRRDCRGDSLVNLTTKRKRSRHLSDEGDNLPNEKENQARGSTRNRIGSPNTDLPQCTLPSGHCSLPSRHEERFRTTCESQTPLQKVDVLSDADSTDSEDSCSDGHMEKLVATLQSRKRSIA